MKISRPLIGVALIGLIFAIGKYAPILRGVDVEAQRQQAAAAKQARSASQVRVSDDAQMKEIKYQRLAREQVTAKLKDPDSAQFRNQKGFCGEVNAKNSFGGYGGFERFIAAGKDLVVFEGDKNLEAGAFNEAWNEFCG